MQNDYDKTSEISFLFLKKKKDYKLVFAGYSEGNDHRFVDLDSDGTPEIIDQFVMRASSEAVVFGIINGKYSLVHSFGSEEGLSHIKVKNKILYFTKDILQNDKFVKQTTRYKYKKGKLIQLK